jgi:type II secretory pathway component PulF
MARMMGLTASAAFCSRFGSSLRAGVDIMKLLETELRNGDSRHQSVMHQVRENVANGHTLSEAMIHADAQYFPPLMLSMVRLGEQTGRLERTLLQLAEHYRHALATRRTFMMAIAWPALQLIAGILAIALLIWLMGILTPVGGGEMFDPLGWGLRGNSGVAIYFTYVFIIALWIWLAQRAVRRNWFNLHSVIPIAYLIPAFGPSIQTITLARFTWTLSMALDAGLDPGRSVGLALDSTDSEYYRSETETAQREIQAGRSLAESIDSTGIFPRDFISAMEVAEISGTDAESLGLLAADYEQRAKMAIRTLAGLATGLIWLTIAGVLIYVIIRMAMNIAGVYNEALEGL